jgi:ribonuclease-3 family protein
MSEEHQGKEPHGHEPAGETICPAETAFGNELMTPAQLVDVSPRALAHLGDAVFHLFERERELRAAATAQQMHTRARVNASSQSALLEKIKPKLVEAELEIVRRARNMKATISRKQEQTAYRRATAFEALLGYLYLTDPARLRSVLEFTLAPEPATQDDIG